MLTQRGETKDKVIMMTIKIKIIQNFCFSVSNSGAYDDLLLELYLNPNKLDDTDDTKTLFKNLLKQFFVNADMAKAYPNLFKLLWFSNIPCFKNNVTSSYLLKKCLWQGEEHDCTDLFKQIPTDSGNP